MRQAVDGQVGAIGLARADRLWLHQEMRKYRSDPKLVREGMRQGLAVGVLVIMAGVAIAGPSGLLAWGRNQQELEVRRAELAQLTTERDELRNRVDLLNPRHVDRDLATELVRSRLGVAHPDDEVMLLH